MSLKQLKRIFDAMKRMTHGDPESVSTILIDSSEAQSMRIVGKIIEGKVGAAGTVTINIYGKVTGAIMTVAIDNFTLTVNGATPVYKSKLVDVRGFEEITVGIIHAGAAADWADIEVWGAVPFER